MEKGHIDKQRVLDTKKKDNLLPFCFKRLAVFLFTSLLTNPEIRMLYVSFSSMLSIKRYYTHVSNLGLSGTDREKKKLSVSKQQCQCLPLPSEPAAKIQIQ